MDNYTIEFINRVKEEVDPAEWFISGNCYCYDTNEECAYDIVPNGHIVEGSMLTFGTVLVIARTTESEPQVHSSSLAPVALVKSETLGILFDVYPII